jgi:hypothetical protein
LAACGALALGCLIGQAQAAIVTSTFDTDTEGWGEFNDGSISWEGDFGNPAGSLHGRDLVRSTVWYFVAPAKFRGDQSDKYGSSLQYDIWLSVFDEPRDDIDRVGDVVIRGNGQQLKWLGADYPAQTWTTQSVKLDVTALWRRSDNNALATEAEIRSVLANLDRLFIRGEFHSGPDHAFLDNVALGVPEPSSFAAFLGLFAIIGLVPRRGR